MLLLLAAGILVAGISSCKKQGMDDDDDQECELTVANLAGVYKLISCYDITTTTPVDKLHEFYDDCELDDTNELKADKTFVYTDAGVSCSPSGSETGTWNVSGTTLILNAGFSNIESFNCKDLVVTFRDTDGKLIKETYRKQ